jgi:hypothetical protein
MDHIIGNPVATLLIPESHRFFDYDHDYVNDNDHVVRNLFLSRYSDGRA